MQISDILQKLGIKSVDELRPDEKKTFQAWQEILAKKDTTIEDLKKFLPAELDRAHAELREIENSAKKDSYYKAYATFCHTMLKIITGPTKERERLQAFLKQKYGLD